jgi:thiol peroxidase
MPRIVKFKGKPLTLVGRVLKVGAKAPDFRATKQDSEEVTLSDFSRLEIKSEGGIPLEAGKGKIKVITFFLSLDTSVCDLQVKEFNKTAAHLSKEIVVIGISKDLPFAQKRFCSDNDINNALIISDYKTSSFGINYGFLIKESNLLARGVVILDANNIVRYIQIADELSIPPDYLTALNHLDEVIKNPVFSIKDELPSHCKPCEGGVSALPKETIDKLIAQYRGWELIEDKKLVKEFKFKDFVEAKYFFDLLSIIAEEQGHHPAFTLIYNKLRVTLTTHASGGLTENDFIMAKIIDELGSDK